jgi:cell division protein FtsL
MAYMRGNLAVKEKTSERVHGAPKYRETTKVVTRRSHLPMREKMLYLLTLVCVVGIAGVLIWRNAYIYELKMKVHESEVNIKEYNTEITESEVQKQKLMDQIPEKAKGLGFTAPESDGIRIDEVNGTVMEDKSEELPATAKK